MSEVETSFIFCVFINVIERMVYDNTFLIVSFAACYELCF
jgi:hypothetical protein